MHYLQSLLMQKCFFAINNPMQAREIARKQLVEGADFIKILGSSVAGQDRDDSSLFYPDEDFDIFNRPCAHVIRDGVLAADHGMVRCV